MRMEPEPASIRALLVEDSENDAELVCLELERAGLSATCVRVDTAPAMERALLEDDWDVILSDFAMPGFNGLEAFRLASALCADVPFIFVSGAIGEERAVTAMRAGARDYVLKDNLTRLGEAVRRELRESAGRRERQRAQAEAAREARRLAIAVEASGAGVFERQVPPTDDDHYSDRWAEILGFPREDLPPPSFIPGWLEARVHPAERAATAAALTRFLEGGAGRLEVETRLRDRRGGWVSVAIFAKALATDASGSVTHLVGVMLDLTARRRLEDELRQAQKMEAVGRLAGGVAHDFNNLLTAIYSFGGFVMESLTPGSPAEEDMREVLAAATRAASLTEQLLTFSRRQPVEPRVVDLGRLLAGVDRMLRRVLGEDVDVSTQLPLEPAPVCADPRALEQVILNLAINARDAMPSGGRLTFEIDRLDLAEEQLAGPARDGVAVPPGRYVVLAVSDDGLGMDEETMSHAFEPFFTTKEVGKGTGLGLSTCYGIVRQAGGTISVYSEPNQGTTFRIYLPRADGDALPADVIRAQAPPRGTETVLVAEDDVQVRRLAERALSRLGYRVLAAETGERALELHRQESGTIHLLITDVVMPSMTGRQLADLVVRERPEIRVLYMSGYTAHAMAHRGVLEPDAVLLQKPFTVDDLARRVRALLDRAGVPA